MGEDRVTSGMARYTVAEAADVLGITTGAVRNRLSRGTLRSTKEDGTVYVFLSADMSRDAERDADDIPPGIPHPEPGVLTSELRDRLRYVEGQLEAERQAHAEARRIIMQQAVTMRQLTAASAQEPPEDAETVEAPPEGAEPRPATGGAQEGTEHQSSTLRDWSDDVVEASEARRPWWRRMFGR